MCILYVGNRRSAVNVQFHVVPFKTVNRNVFQGFSEGGCLLIKGISS